MYSLIARGDGAGERWERELGGAMRTLGRTGSRSDWEIPWDTMISRRHAELTWKDGRLFVRKDPNATNQIFVRGEPHDDFSIGPGESFVIGRTTFEVREMLSTIALDLPTPARVLAVDDSQLSQIKYDNADERIEAIAALPKEVRRAKSDDELQSKVVAVLLRGIPRAEAAAVVRLDTSTLGRSEIAIPCVQSRYGGTQEFRPSRRLIVEAIQQRRERMAHIWNALDPWFNADDAGYTPFLGCDWALCAPMPDEPLPGWGLYVVGRLPASLRAAGNEWHEDQLRADLKFTELVADVFGSLRQVAHLERVESQLARFFSRPVRSVLLGQDAEQALAPRETDATILFCDLRGSCRIADDAQEDLAALWQRISVALSIMTGSIIERDGVIGDFQGDAAMGFWGWPLQASDQIERAARAALSIRKQFAEASAKENNPLAGFHCGIAIAHGRAFAGQLGTVDQAKVGVYGPRVNLASRLESLTKTFQVPILIDDRVTAGLVGVNSSNWARVRRVAHVRPVGMREALMIGELMPAYERGAMADSVRRDYEAGLDCFLAGQWSDARRLLARLSDDGPAEFLTRYMREHTAGPPDRWDGIISLASK